MGIYRDLSLSGWNMSMDQLVQTIEMHKQSAKILEEIKSQRIKDGEETPEMVKRRRKKEEKAKAGDGVQEEPRQMSSQTRVPTPVQASA